MKIVLPSTVKRCLIVGGIFLIIMSLSVSASAAAVNPNVIVNKNAAWAGYKVLAPAPGTIIMLHSNWVVPTFESSCFSPFGHSYFKFDIQISHIYSADVGSQLFAGCTTIPVYFMNFTLGAGGSKFLPAVDLVKAGDKMLTVATIKVSTGAITLRISDTTAGWTFTTTGTEKVSTSKSGAVEWLLYGTTTLLPKFSTFKTANDNVTLGAHSGVLGSFLTISADTFTDYSMINSVTKDVLAQPGAITTTSSSFSFFWIQST